MTQNNLFILFRIILILVFNLHCISVNSQTGVDMGASPCFSCPKSSPSQPVINNSNNTIQQTYTVDLVQQRLSEATAANKKGIDYYKNKDWANAIIAFQEAVDKNPGNQTLKDNLAIAKQELQFQQDELRRIQQNKDAVLRMQQSIQGYTQTLNTNSQTNGLNFDGKNTTTTSGNNSNGNGLNFISGNSTPSLPNPGVTSSTINGLQFGDPNVVNTQNIPSGLKKETDDAITGAYKNAPPGVSDRVRKGFQAVATNDWKVARAWFLDALKLDPDNEGLKKFIALCDYTPGSTSKLNVSPAPQNNTVVNVNKPTNDKLIIPTSDDAAKIFIEADKNNAVTNVNTPSKAEIKQWFEFMNDPTVISLDEFYKKIDSPQAEKMRRYINSLSEDEFKRLLNINLTTKQTNELMFEYLIKANEQLTPLNKTHQ